MKEMRNFSGPPKRIDDKTYSIDLDITVIPHITGTIAEAISVARDLNATMQFNFNRVTILVCSDSDPKLIERDWWRVCSGYINGNVGPYPNPVLTDKEKKRDAHIETQKECQRLTQLEAQARTDREAAEAKLAWMEFEDEKDQ